MTGALKGELFALAQRAKVYVYIAAAPEPESPASVRQAVGDSKRGAQLGRRRGPLDTPEDDDDDDSLQCALLWQKGTGARERAGSAG